MTKFIHSLWRRRWLRVCVWVVVVIMAALVCLREYIDWSGARQWEAVQAMLAREGESLDIRKVAPPPVPDDQNFCAIPALKDIVLWPDNDNSEWGLKRKRLIDSAIPRDTKAVAKIAVEPGTFDDKLKRMLSSTHDYFLRPKIFGSATSGKAADMAALAKWFRWAGWISVTTGTADPAQQLLAWQSSNDALVNELAQGLIRPDSQWTPAWKDRPLDEPLFKTLYTYYTPIQAVSSMLCFRSIVAARAGDTFKAHQSLETAVRINQAAINDPIFISLLVSGGISSIIASSVWEVCDAHSGTAEEFHVLQSELSKLDYRRGLLQAQRSELALNANTTRFLARTRNPMLFLPFLPPPTYENRLWALGFKLIPAGWYDLNGSILAQWQFDYSIKPLRDAGFKEQLAKQDRLDALVNSLSQNSLRYTFEFMALNGATVSRNISYRMVYTQSVVNEAIAACALERYRIEHGSYPDTLEAANHPGEPAIPVDVISGQPMHYRKTPNGMYALWCVGFDGKDDGGKRVLDPSRPDHTQFTSPDYKGDWVWDFSGESGRFK